MSTSIRSLFLFVCFTALLSGCAPPAVTPTEAIPTEAVATPLAEPPTVTPTPKTQVSIPIEGSNETVEATMIGNGEIVVMIVTSWEEDVSAWMPLIDRLASNERLSIVSFPYRNFASTLSQDTIAVFDYVRAQGANKIIPVCSGFGSRPCVLNLSKEPEVIGMVLLATDAGPIRSGFPKLFLTADTDPNFAAGATKNAYDYSDEPKTFKSYPAGVSGAAIFSKPEIGSQVLADITDFINEIVSSQ